MKKVLNVGGNNQNIDLPGEYEGWEKVLLDIDPRGTPDIVCDARDLVSLPASQFDAVYCSHNLEHYYRHDGRKVLNGFRHVIKDDGFIHIRVPDIGQLLQIMVQRSLDIDDFLYHSPMGPITVRDVLYGHSGEIESSGTDFYAHKTGFTRKALMRFIQESGFPVVFIKPGDLEIIALAFKGAPGPYATALFNLPATT
jgi:SAM-dependent methyltransferase